jgi:sugar phosphate isomerase/epimerase
MNRRAFTKMAGLGAMAMHSFPAVSSAMNSMHDREKESRVPLGICNHTLRALRPNAGELIEFAMEHSLDSVQFNTLKPFESLEPEHLESLRDLAGSNDITIYLGVGSISEQSVRFSDDFGDAAALLTEGFRVAKILGSPVLGVRIGVLEDRYTNGGIEPNMEEVMRLMRSFETDVMDSGIKFAFENHAGDMRSEELLELIERTGEEICGAFFDPGNAIYAMEDPLSALESVGPHILCCQARDVVIWPTETGATFQWTAVGEGMMDFGFYTQYLRENCPGVPIHLETISNSPREIPYLTTAYWEGWPRLKASGMIDFLKMVREGHPIEVARAPEGTDQKAFDIENQTGEFLRSIEYLRSECGAGIKTPE